MINRLFFFVLLALFPCTGFTQTPGYMGKKLVIRYENSFMQAWSQPNSKGKAVSAYGAENSFFSFNATHSLGAEYVTGRKRTFGLSFKYLRTGAFTSYSSYTNYPTRYPLGIISGYGIGISSKRFNKKYIAPWGFYREIEVFMLMHRLENYYPAKYYSTPPDPVEYPFFKNAGVSFAFGKQRVIKDAVTLNYGAKFGLLFKREYYRYDNPELTDEELNIKNISATRLFRHQLINLTLGIGFLAH